MNSGYFKIHRKLFDNNLWLLEPFTRGQAWIDLIGLARYEKGSIMVRGININLERGDVGWSILNLSKRWKWSRGKVYRFLELLEKNSQIVQKWNNKTDIKLTTVITIVNYDLYQTESQQNGHQTDIKRTSNRTLINKDNKYNIYNKEKKEKNSSRERAITFKRNNNNSTVYSLSENDLKSISEKYSCPLAFVVSKYDDMINWHEKNPQKNHYKNYLSALRDWVKRDLLSINQKNYERNSKIAVVNTDES